MRASVAANPLLNRPEQILYRRLVRALPGHIILSHVALWRLLAADGAHPENEAPAPGSRSRWLIADFVVCRPDFTPVAVVEIGTGAHDGERVRHRRNDQLLQAAGVKVIRLAAGDLPHEAALKALIAAHPLHASTEQLARRAS